MYSGITQGLFSVTQVDRQPDLLNYYVDLKQLAQGLQIGASVNIDGVCQTVVAIDNTQVLFQAIKETLAITTLNFLQPGDRVSVERSLKMGDEIGGHLIAGHVNGMGAVVDITASTQQRSLLIEVPAVWMSAILSKGYIAINGSSLTIGEIDQLNHRFWVHLIPETLRLTNLGQKNVGDKLNIELDQQTSLIIKTVKSVLQQSQI